MIFSWRLNVCHNSQTHLYSMVILAESAIQHTFGCCCCYYYYCCGCHCRRRRWCCCCFRLNLSQFFSVVVRCVYALRIHVISACLFWLLLLLCDFTQSKIRLCAYRCCCCCAFILLLFFFSFLFRSCFFLFCSLLFILFVRVPYPIRSKPICIECCVYV